MQSPWWDGERLGPGAVALVVFPQTAQTVVPEVYPAPGAASSGAVSVLLSPEMLGNFIRQHREAILVCYNAAELHWLLEGHFRNDAESLDVLWDFSREGRLLDVMLLDQRLRDTAAVGVAPQQMCELILRLTGGKLPPDREVRELVAKAWAKPGSALDGDVASILLAVAAGIFRTGGRLVEEAHKVADLATRANDAPRTHEMPLLPAEQEGVEAANQRLLEIILARRQSGVAPPTRPAAQDQTAQAHDSVRSHSFGTLGIGIDVLGAIAVGRLGRPTLQPDPNQVEILRHKNLERFQKASRKLHQDLAARRCFRWKPGEEPLVARDHQGRLVYNVDKISDWLRGFEKVLFDVHNLPPKIPTTHDGKPSFDAEKWGILASSNRLLGAWRNLDRAARLDRDLAECEHLACTYFVVPVVRSNRPDLVAYRSLNVAGFRPRTGHIFVIGNLPLLDVYCFAAARCQHRRNPPSRLACHFLEERNWANAEEERDPLGEIAGHLWAISSGAVRVGEQDDDSGTDVPSSPAPLDDALGEFAALEQRDPGAYQRWRLLTQALLKLVPAGLPASLISICLEQDYGLDIKASDVETLKMHLMDRVVYEVRDFLDDEVSGWLRDVLGLSAARGVDLLAEKEHLATTDAALRNDLRERRKGSPVWEFIRKARQDQPDSPLPTDEEIIEKVLLRRARTPAGRMIGPAYHTEVRRQEIRLIADEVMKSVAYALVAAELPLAAVVDGEFLLEVPEAQATDELLGQVTELASDAGRRIVGTPAPRCRCERSYTW